MQKVVRTFPNSYTNKTTRLSELLDQGYEVIMCNPFFIDGGLNGLEYIVEKKDNKDND